MKTLLLVDGSSYLYRAFHALPDLRSPQGEPTGALYGVLNMLRRLKADFPSDYSAVVFDAKGKTFRDDWYPDYKAHRPPMPDDLRLQVEPLHRLVRASGWKVIVEDGVEADDVIGTLARQASQAGVRCVISTGDKDLTQLVDDYVLWINTMSEERLDAAGVAAKFGVPPERIVDYLTLVGDAVDNVPGVPKCGPKTAVKWLAEYGSLDELIANSGKVKGVVGDNLRATLDWLPQARRLVTVKCDVPLSERYDQLTSLPQDTDILRTEFAHWGFRTWLREVSGEASPSGPLSRERERDGVRGVEGVAPPLQPSPPLPLAGEGVRSPDLPANDASRYETLFTPAQLNAWLERLLVADLVALDTETTGLDPLESHLVGLSLCIEPGHAAYLPLAHVYPGAPDQLDRAATLEKLRPWLEGAQYRKVGQNLKFDQHIFANHGIALAGVAEDTLLQSYVLESHLRHDLETLIARHLGLSCVSYAEVVGKGAKQICFDQVDLDTATRYAAEDADLTLRVFQVLAPQLQDRQAAVYRDIELPVREVLYRMERNGVLLDSRLLNVQSRELGEKLIAIEALAFEAAGQPFNLNSPKQLGEILFDKLGLPVKKKTPSGAPSTDEEVLQELALDYPLPKLLLEHRSLSKLKSTYTDKLPQMVNRTTSRVHTSYSQAVAVTGRLASSDPNLQNIPVRTAEGRRIREAFIAAPGCRIVSADYSQIELRIMAHLSEDAGLLRAFANGEDIHRATAAEVFGVAPEAVSSEQRRYAKVINFGLIYGMSAFGLAAQLDIERSAAQAYIDRYFARYPGVADYMQRTREQAREQGYVETVFGRRLWLPEIKSSNGAKRQAAERAAINAPMQGTAADLIKLAMIAVQGWLEQERLQTRLIMQVHDELVLEVPATELTPVKEKLRELMCHVAELKVLLEVGLGDGANWEAAH